MATMTVLTLAAPAGTASASDSRHRPDGVDTWRTARGTIVNYTDITWGLGASATYPNGTEWLEAPPSRIEPGEEVTFATGYDSGWMGSGLSVVYYNNLNSKNQVYFRANCVANGSNVHDEQNDSDSYKAVFSYDNGTSTNSYSVRWHIEKR
ncbi:hypothetical protein BS329_37665 [Amycolatopsis coloradensis]|uniref:Uncharacterized protein n=2 Tax=Amycolatopsis coloradensis TaxID=76021 RepID=A0A1R0KFK8_9PSEU|nr:hypothetical protein BS329_37665 [Amycolatopsis coloradensis]